MIQYNFRRYLSRPSTHPGFGYILWHVCLCLFALDWYSQQIPRAIPRSKTGGVVQAIYYLVCRQPMLDPCLTTLSVRFLDPINQKISSFDWQRFGSMIRYPKWVPCTCTAFSNCHSPKKNNCIPVNWAEKTKELPAEWRLFLGRWTLGHRVLTHSHVFRHVGFCQQIWFLLGNGQTYSQDLGPSVDGWKNIHTNRSMSSWEKDGVKSGGQAIKNTILFGWWTFVGYTTVPHLYTFVSILVGIVVKQTSL